MVGRRFCYGAVLVVCMAAAATAAAAGPSLEPRADRVLREASALLGGADRFTFRVESMRGVVAEGGQKIHYHGESTVAVARPQQVWADGRGDRGGFRMWYDGKRFTALDKVENTYSSVPLTGSIDEAFDFLAKEFGISPPLVDLIYSDLYGVVTKAVNSGFYAGLHELGGVSCHHLAFSGDEIDVEVWVEDGLLPLPRKIIISYKGRDGAPQFEAQLHDWDLSPEFREDLFRFSLPEDAQFLPLETVVEQRKGR